VVGHCVVVDLDDPGIVQVTKGAGGLIVHITPRLITVTLIQRSQKAASPNIKIKNKGTYLEKIGNHNLLRKANSSLPSSIKQKIRLSP
jgi:hypothetical protein